MIETGFIPVVESRTGGRALAEAKFSVFYFPQTIDVDSRAWLVLWRRVEAGRQDNSFD